MKMQANPLGSGARGTIAANSVSPAQTTAGAYLKPAVTNYRSKSPAFTISNNAIVFLDATFNSYDVPTKDSWSTAASSMPGAMTCGCHAEAITGQKLHRWWNYQAAVGGGAIDSTPPDVSTWYTFLLSEFDKEHFNGGSFPDRVFIPTSANSQDTSVQIHLPDGTKLFITIATGVFQTYINRGDPGFDQLWNVPQGTRLAWCATAADGTLLTAGISPVFYFDLA